MGEIQQVIISSLVSFLIGGAASTLMFWRPLEKGMHRIDTELAGFKERLDNIERAVERLDYRRRH